MRLEGLLGELSLVPLLSGALPVVIPDALQGVNKQLPKHPRRKQLLQAILQMHQAA